MLWRSSLLSEYSMPKHLLTITPRNMTQKRKYPYKTYILHGHNWCCRPVLSLSLFKQYSKFLYMKQNKGGRLRDTITFHLYFFRNIEVDTHVHACI
jgi:hypothetical protein